MGALTPKSLNIFPHLFSLLVFILKDSGNTSAIYTGHVLDLMWTRGGGREDYVKKKNVALKANMRERKLWGSPLPLGRCQHPWDGCEGHGTGLR